LAQVPTRLGKREIGFALAMGVVAAGGIALVVYDDNEDHGPGFVEQFEPGEDADVTYQLTAFNEVTSIGSQDVMITQGDAFSVRAEGPANRIEDLEAVVEDGRLVIRPRDGGPNIRLTGHDDVTFHITMPQIEQVTLAGSGDVMLGRVEGASFAALVDGSGQVEIADLAVGQADLRITGSGDMVVSGTADNTEITVEGSGEVDGQSLSSTNGTITITGSGDASLDVTDRANISITGSGDVDVSGPGLCTVTTVGSGDVRCEGSDDED